MIERRFWRMLALLVATIGVLLPVSAQTVTYTIISVPGSINTILDGIDGNNVVGTYDDSEGTHMFVYSEGQYKTIRQTNLTTIPCGISGDNIVGNYHSGIDHGFIYNGHTYANIDPPGTLGTTVTAVSGDNVVGMYQNRDGGFNGFLYRKGVYTTLAGVSADAVDGDDIVGKLQNSNHAYLYNKGQALPIQVPKTSSISPYITRATAVSHGRVAGYFNDTQNNYHGFLYDGAKYLTLDPPGGFQLCKLFLSGPNISYANALSPKSGVFYDGKNFIAIQPPGAVYGFSMTGLSGNKVIGSYTDTHPSTHAFLATVQTAPQ